MVKQYRQNKTLQSYERKFYQPTGEELATIYKQTDARKAKRFWNKIRDHNKKSRMD